MHNPASELFPYAQDQEGDVMERYRSGHNGVDSKSICPVKSGARGFESHPLRQILLRKIWRDLSTLVEDPPFLKQNI